MPLQVGIVGLPNVGKSTLFNALTKQSAKAQNVPFTTIEPNVGIVPVPDERLDVLTKISKSQKTVPTTIEFVDIAGLVKNAHKGEGLGNQFLSNIREVDAIVHVIRHFEDTNITHVEGRINPEDDKDIIKTELILADLNQVQNMRGNLIKKVKAQEKESIILDGLLAKYEEVLSAGKVAREVTAEEEAELDAAKHVHLLTTKPVLHVANVSENNINQEIPDHLALSIKIEQELVELEDEDRQVFMEEYGLKESGLDKLIRAAYEALGLITFFTSGEPETKAWTVKAGALAPQAASVIHTDFETGFIRAETVAYSDLASAGSYAAARAAGKVRDEGKNYTVKDGDVMLFKFSK